MAIILPISKAAAREASSAEFTAATTPGIALPSISLAMRFGPTNKAIGYINQFARTHTRSLVHLKQLEPYPNGTFSSAASSMNFNTDYGTSQYFPGETVEVVPGPLGDESITLQRYALYTSMLFEAVVRADGADIARTDYTTKNINDIASGRLVSLLQQTKACLVLEIYVSPIDGSTIYGVQYIDCWFSDMGRTVAQGTNFIQESGKLEVTRTRPASLANKNN